MNIKNIKSLKGMKDILSEDLLLYNYVESSLKKILNNYSYKEIRFPIIENIDLFSKKFFLGDNILKNEMYILNYYNNSNKLCLRPEGTMGCLRFYKQNKLFVDGFLKKLWYSGPMFRCEKPQKARFRQFHQIGLEVIGGDNLFSLIELILITKKLWEVLGVDKYLCLEINNIGYYSDRNKYINFLNNYISSNNVNFKFSIKNCDLLRILDSGHLNIDDIPEISKFLSKESLLNFKNICFYLKKLNVNYLLNKNLFRGLDYYNNFVFEWKYYNFGSQNAICAGGSYDEMASNFLNFPICSSGLAIGLDRLVVLLKELKYKNKKINILSNKIDIYILSINKIKSRWLSVKILEKILKSDLCFMKIYNDYSFFNNISKCISKIVKLNIRILIIIGYKEIKNNYLTVKDLYKNIQKNISMKHDIVKCISDLLK